jgi:hypothetical protein
MTFAYSVRAAFDEAAVAAEYEAWLRDGHLAHVILGGAREAMLVKLGPLEFEARYLFADAEAFATYEKVSAPALRAEGLAKFPASRGVRMMRSQGEVLERLTAV